MLQAKHNLIKTSLAALQMYAWKLHNHTVCCTSAEMPYVMARPLGCLPQQGHLADSTLSTSKAAIEV